MTLLSLVHMCIIHITIATMYAIMVNEGNLSDITNFVWGPFCFGCKTNSSRVPGWHPADFGSGHVQVI